LSQARDLVEARILRGTFSGPPVTVGFRRFSGVDADAFLETVAVALSSDEPLLRYGRWRDGARTVGIEKRGPRFGISEGLSRARGRPGSGM